VESRETRGQSADPASPHFFLGTRIGLISKLPIGTTRSWIAASSAEAKCT
jgi:hypothetical protein